MGEVEDNVVRSTKQRPPRAATPTGRRHQPPGWPQRAGRDPRARKRKRQTDGSAVSDVGSTNLQHRPPSPTQPDR